MRRLLCLLALPLAGACNDAGPHELTRSSWAANAGASRRASEQAVRPLEPATGLDARKVALGRDLFHDPVLSGGAISCSSCHDLENGGDDGLPRSIGASGRPAARNAPTVLNAALHFRQFWDGRAASLEEQMDGPIQHEDEMGTSWPDAVRRVSEQSRYRVAFEELYGALPTEATVKDAIATFERTLLTPGAPFDAFLAGDETALDDAARKGWERFRAYGCISCHQGVALGGNMFQVFGVFGNPYEEAGADVRSDLGRYEVTGREEDRFVFKVPSLRNVAATAPYFHDGSVPRLEDAIRLMLRYQLGREPQDDDVATLEAFLRSLTGRLDGRAIE